jgi:hypothetical protein
VRFYYKNVGKLTLVLWSLYKGGRIMKVVGLVKVIEHRVSALVPNIIDEKPQRNKRFTFWKADFNRLKLKLRN